MTRTETDSMGPVEIAADRLWGAQTQRSLDNFAIGRPAYVWGRTVIRSLGLTKRAAAIVNTTLGVLDPEQGSLIDQAGAEVIAGQLDSHFPLVVFQTGSGTQTNMNANEVIANRANQLAGAALGGKSPVHPNDHVNAGQSSNDVFPTVMHLAAVLALHEQLYPVLDELRETLGVLRDRYADVVKVGRTHLQDATPITLGQEIGAWEAQIAAADLGLREAELHLRALAIGGTAVGTGLNTPPSFGGLVAAQLSEDLGLDFTVTNNHFAATSSHDAMVTVSAALRTLAGAAMKMANDIRWLASGPRNGIGELRLPANEPGSSIMPGKVNPTQIEALTMVAVRVFGNDAAVAFAGTQGNFQLNVYKPLILHNTLDSVTLLAEAISSFNRHCLAGLEPDRAKIAENLDRNLMLVTALAPHIGYDAASEIAKVAQKRGLTLREAALDVGHLTGEQYDAWVDPQAMTNPG